MQRSERRVDLDHPLGRLVVRAAPWAVHELIFTPERIRWLGDELKKYPSLTTDPTRDDANRLWHAVSSPQSFWTEVWDESQGKCVGILYASQIEVGVDAMFHPVFFDRHLTEKAPVCLEAIKWAQRQFSLHRMTVAIPDIYFATVRLAKKLGFKLEGTRREVYMINGKWCDELQFGLLTSEMAR